MPIYDEDFKYVTPEELEEVIPSTTIEHPDVMYVNPEDLYDIPKPKKVASRPKAAQRRKPRVTQPAERQVFRQQLPPSVGEQAARNLAMSGFNFDTRPYKAFEAMTPQEKLQLAAERGVPGIRAATSSEQEQTRRIEERETAVRNRKRGPSLFGLVEPMRELGEAHQTLTYETPNVFLKGLTSMPEGAAELGRTVARKLVPKWAPSAEGPASPTLRRFTNYMAEEIEDTFPTDQQNVNPVAQTLGSAAQFIIPGRLLTKVGVPAAVTSGVMGATMNTQQIAREMERFKDITPERKDAAIAMAAMTGLSEMVGLGRAIDKFGLRQEFIRRMIDIAEEGGQEALQQWLNNLNAKVVGAYDKKRALTKDMFMSFMMGTMGGAMFQGIGLAKQREMNRAAGTPPPPAQRWRPESMPAEQMELPFPPDVEEVGVPRPELEAIPEAERQRNEPSLVDLGGGFGETKRVWPKTQSPYGEDLGVVKVGKRGRKPKQMSIMPTEEERLLDIEGGIEIPIPSKEEWDAPEQFPLTEAIMAGRKPTAEVMRNTDPMTGLPLASAEMLPQDALERREDNLLEYLRDSVAFDKKGNPIQGYFPSVAPTQHSTIDMYMMRGQEFGDGMDIYQNPETANYLANDKWALDPNYQDIKDHPDWQSVYDKILKRKIDGWKSYNSFGGDPGPTTLQGFEYEARNEADKVIAGRYQFGAKGYSDEGKYARSPNIRPFYMNVTNPYDMDVMYGANHISAIREAIRRDDMEGPRYVKGKEAIEQRNWAIDDMLRIQEEEILDGVEPGITGRDLYFAINHILGGDVDKWGRPSRASSVNRILKAAGFDAMIYTDEQYTKPKQFMTMEEAQDFADQTGGRVVTDPVMLEPSRSYNDPATNQFVTVPEKYSVGPTVVGSRVWKLWTDGSVKSATGNTGDFDPSRPEVYATADYPRGWGPSDIKTDITQQYSGDPLAFDVMPALTQGQAPYLRMPQWAMNAISGKTNVYGYNIAFGNLKEATEALRKSAPSQEAADIAVTALFDLAVQSKVGSNVNSLSLVSNEDNRQQPSLPGMEDARPYDDPVRGRIEHEVFHAAQRQGAVPTARFAQDHPIVQKIIGPDSMLRRQNPGDTEAVLAQRAAIEIPTYTIQGKVHQLGLSSAEAIDYLMDYYTHILETQGKAGIDRIRRVSGRMRPEMVEALDLAESMWEGWQAMREGTSGFLGELAAAEPDIEVNSPVQSKSRGKAGVVIAMGTDEDGRWAEVRFADGSTEELYLKDLKLVAGVKTPKVPNKTKAQEEIKKAPVVSVMGSGQMFLPGMEGSRKDVVVEPPVPPNLPPTQPMLPGMEGPQYPPVEVKQVSNVYNQAVDQAFSALLEANGVKFRINDDVFLQVADAIAEGKIDGKRFQEALAENGLTREQFVERFKNTTSDAGRTLAYLSHVKQRWLKAMAKNNELKDILFTPSELFEMLLKDINNTELGMSLWQRASTIVRMLMLSDIHTAAVNSIMTAARIPLAIGVHGGGAWLKTMADGRAQGKTLAQNINDATDASLDAMKAGLEVLLVMNPVDIAKAFVGKDSRQGHHEFVVNELFKAFPDLKHKLKDPGIGTDKPTELGDMLNIAEKLVEDIRTGPARKKALSDLKIYQDRFNSNVEGIGNILKGPEVALDWILTPMRWQEWFFRRPMFVGYLDLALRRNNLNSLEDLIRDDELKSIPEELLEAAIDEALDFTYAYMPKIDGPGMEKSAYHLIKGINELKGASSMIGTMFPRAIYNGMKFTYEYSPLGALPGIKKMMRPKTQTDPVDNVEFRTNPLTQKDYDRFAKATLGTVMFAGAMSLLKFGLMGDEWWQVKTHRKTPDGRPIYLDIRRYQPFATFYRLADLTDRLFTSTGIWQGDRRLGDLQFGKELKETLTGLRSFPGMEEYLSATAEMWTDEDAGNVQQKAKSSVGMGLAYLTRPLINLRHAVAMFDEDENKRRDLKGTGILGPLVDNVPWARRLLPEYQSPTEPSPVRIYQYPELLMVGAKYSVGEGYAGREWKRLGFLNRRFIPPDPNPKINRLQNEFFRNMIYDIGQSAESDPSYQQLNDVDRAAYWERIAQKVAPAAAKFGLTADPQEAVKRKAREKANVGELQYKAMGIGKMLQDNAIQKPDQQEVERLSRQAVQ